MRLIWLKTVVLAGFMAFPGTLPGQAADFNYTGLDGRIVSFSLPDSPDPGLSADPIAGFFGLTAMVLDSFAGPDSVSRDFTFYLPVQSGGFFYFPDPILSLAGETLFTGGVLTPTFVAGTYELNFFDIVTLEVTGPAGTLVISGIPEPVGMATLGIGLLGLAVARRQRDSAASYQDKDDQRH